MNLYRVYIEDVINDGNVFLAGNHREYTEWQIF